jgi:hypothetical protein
MEGEGDDCRICGGGTEDLEHVMIKCEGLRGERESNGWAEEMQAR